SGAPAESIAEGTAVNLTSDASDAGTADTLTYAWSVKKDNAAYDLGETTTDADTFSFTPNDNGSYEVTLTVTDDDGGVKSKAVVIDVTNANPTATISGEPAESIVEGAAVALTVTPADAGSEDTFTYAWTVKKDNATYDLGDTTVNAASLTFTTNDNGDYVATCVVSDDEAAT